MSAQKVALVTGANKGIGFEVCRQLGARKFHVFLAERRQEEGLKACGLLQQAGLLVSFLQLDVTDAQSVQLAAEILAREAGRLDVLVNNAGICEDAESSILEVSAEVVRGTLETNTLGPLFITQKLWPLLAKSAQGRIINVSSGLGSLNRMNSGYPSYRMSKAALNAFTRVLAAELRSKGVAVNAVSPGWVRTDMGGPSANNSVEEGADSIVWLAPMPPKASRDNSWRTGGRSRGDESMDRRCWAKWFRSSATS
jgi:NAD(P)-dependent dehydrogenase (short-subunit alcohol dehydrogenase family)